MNAFKHVAIFSFCLITACTAPQQQPTEEIATINKLTPSTEKEKSKDKAKTAAITSWEIQGALAAKANSKGWSATMNWIQNGLNSYQIRLIGPLGGGTVVISRQGNNITFQDGAKKATSKSADELLLKQTGIKLPVNNLYFWVRGMPAPGSIQADHYDQSGHLAQLNQNGYTINFTQYTVVKGVALPTMIRLEGKGIMVKIVIKQWSI